MFSGVIASYNCKTFCAPECSFFASMLFSVFKKKQMKVVLITCHQMTIYALQIFFEQSFYAFPENPEKNFAAQLTKLTISIGEHLPIVANDWNTCRGEKPCALQNFESFDPLGLETCEHLCPMFVQRCDLLSVHGD